MSETKKPLLLEHLRELATRAHSGTSFSPERRGDSIVNDYSAELDCDLCDIDALAVKYERQALSEATQARYKDRYVQLLTAWLHSKTNIVSTMIAGPANFPVARMQKYNQWERNKYEAFREWRTKALKAVEKSYRPAVTINTELSKAQADLAAREAKHIQMKAANVIIRDAIKARAKVSDTIEALLNVGLSLPEVQKIVQPDHGGRRGYTYHLQNNLQNIQRLKDRVAELTGKSEQAKTEPKETEENGVRILHNYELDRLQLFFPDKPPVEIRDMMKRSGWRWSPYNGCWQRKITPEAARSAKQIIAAL